MSWSASKELVGWVDLTQWTCPETETSWHDTEYQDSNLCFGKRSACYWKNVVVVRTHAQRWEGSAYLGDTAVVRLYNEWGLV
jgi:hypothetical protein